VYLISFIDVVEDYIPICLFVLAEGKISFYIISVKLLVFSSLSILIYVVIFGSSYLAQKKTTTAQNSAADGFKSHLSSRLFKTLIVNTILQVIRNFKDT